MNIWISIEESFYFILFFKEIRAYQLYLHARGAKSKFKYINLGSICNILEHVPCIYELLKNETEISLAHALLSDKDTGICKYNSLFNLQLRFSYTCTWIFVQIIYFKRIFSLFIFLLITVTWIKWRNLISWLFNNND